MKGLDRGQVPSRSPVLRNPFGGAVKAGSHSASRSQPKSTSDTRPIIDHIQITVQDMAVAVPFYDKLLPLLGFSAQSKSTAVIESHDFHVVEYSHPQLTLAISSPRKGLEGEKPHRRRPGALHHLAFRVESRAEVDRIHSELAAIGAPIVSPPREYPEYTPSGYYAVFFKDLEGIKYEVVTHDKASARNGAA